MGVGDAAELPQNCNTCTIRRGVQRKPVVCGALLKTANEFTKPAAFDEEVETLCGELAEKEAATVRLQEAARAS